MEVCLGLPGCVCVCVCVCVCRNWDQKFASRAGIAGMNSRVILVSTVKQN